MSYEKQTFVDNETILKAEHLNHIEQGIVDLQDNCLSKNQGSENVGKIPVVGTDGNFTLIDMPEGSNGDVVGVLDESNNILLTGNLADGTYTLKYENEDGTVTDIGTLEVGTIVEVTSITATKATTTYNEGDKLTTNDITVTAHYSDGTSSVVTDYSVDSSSVQMGTVGSYNLVISYGGKTTAILITVVAEEIINQIPLSTDSSGNLYVGTDGEAGYKTGYRLSSSSGNESASSGTEVTGFIPAKLNDIIYIENIVIALGGGIHNMCFYDSNKTYITGVFASTVFGGVAINGEVASATLSESISDALGDGFSYIRLSAGEITDESILTVNQTI